MRSLLEFLAALFAVLFLASTATIDRAAAQELIKVRVAYDGFTMTSGPLIYAEKQGIFRKFGLDVSPVFIDGGSTLTQSILGGSIDIAQNGYTPAIAAEVAGGDVVIIGGIVNKLPFQLVVQNQITSPAKLKGRNIAISRYGSSTDTAADFALGHLGLNRNEVTVLQLGGAATRIAAAMSGQIAGTMEQYPDTAELGRRGFHVLVDVTEIAGDYPNTSFDTSRTFMRNHPDVVKRFLMAMATAVHDYKTNPRVAIPLTQKFLDVKNATDMRVAYESYSRVFPNDLRPSLKGIRLVLDELAKKDPKAKSITPDQVVDTSILDRLGRDGFFMKLAAIR
jgi:NitT/TauT family transport system substrate-binding protein